VGRQLKTTIDASIVYDQIRDGKFIQGTIKTTFFFKSLMDFDDIKKTLFS
jgi:hypothetical protein